MYRSIRLKKHKKIRKKITGTKVCPRLSVFRSSQHISAQLINDEAGMTLTAVSDIKLSKDQKTKKAYDMGKKLAQQALKLKIKKVVFDRGGFLYHGRVADFAKGAREGGLEF